MKAKAVDHTIPDAKYYLIRLFESNNIYIMDAKPDCRTYPFYKDVSKYAGDVRDYLEDNAVDVFNLDFAEHQIYSSLGTLDLIPDAGSMICVYDKPETVNNKSVLKCTDTFNVEQTVAEYYSTHDWHISKLLELEPFKEYIQKNYIQNNCISTEISEKTNLNKRLLI